MDAPHCVSSCVLRVCLCTSSDHEYVDGYRVQIISATFSTSSIICRARFGHGFTILHDVAFDSKVSWLTALLKKRTVADTACILHALSLCSLSLQDDLTLVVHGTQAVEKFFPLFDQNCNYLIGVSAACFTSHCVLHSCSVVSLCTIPVSD